ncbi:hypothetical protein D3C72_972190 [compost metagenome]
MLHADFRSVLDLLHAAAKHFAQRTGRHRTGHADFTLAADFSAGDRCVLLVENADGRSGQQKPYDAVVIRAWDKTHVVMQHRWNDPRRAVGGGSDHTSAIGVFFVDRQSVEVDPVEH